MSRGNKLNHYRKFEWIYIFDLEYNLLDKVKHAATAAKILGTKTQYINQIIEKRSCFGFKYFVSNTMFPEKRKGVKLNRNPLILTKSTKMDERTGGCSQYELSQGIRLLANTDLLNF